MRNIISSQLEIGQIDITNIVIDVTSRDDIPLILLGLQHIYTTLICKAHQTYIDLAQKYLNRVTQSYELLIGKRFFSMAVDKSIR